MAKVKARQINNSLSVFVWGIGMSSKEHLESYFSKFGKVSNIYLKHPMCNYAIIEMSDQESLDKILSEKSHQLNGKKLTVSKKKIPKEDYMMDITKESETPLLDHTTLLRRLTVCSSIEQQIEMIQELLLLKEEEIIKREERIKRYVETPLQEYFPGCRIHLYGSTKNGFGFKGCDVDVFLNIVEPNSKNSTAPATLRQDWNPNVSAFKAGYVSQESLYFLPFQNQLRFVKKVLDIHASRHSILIHSKRCPIIRLQIEGPSLYCDVSLGKEIGLAVYNTRLLHLFRELDFRVGPLVTILVYWAKQHDIIEHSHKFSSYAFIFMVIFFLQTRNPPILPTVEMLRSQGEMRIVNGWDCSFYDDKTNIPSFGNTQTIVELIPEFFHFYLTFDFMHDGICLRNASVVPKRQFILENIPDFKIGQICIQDPFDLSHNLTASICRTYIINLIKNFESGIYKCQQTNFKSSEEKGDLWGLSFLLSKDPVFLELDLIPDIKRHLYCFEIMMDANTIPNSKEYTSSDHYVVKKKWLKKVCEIIFEVLKDALLCECKIKENHILESDSASHKCNLPLEDFDELQTIKSEVDLMETCDSDKPKSNTLSKSVESNISSTTEGTLICGKKGYFIGSSDLLMVINCEGRQCVSENRKMVVKKLCDYSVHNIGIQRKVSEYIIEEYGKTNQKKVKFDYFLQQVQRGGITSLHATVQCEDLNFVSFLKSYLPKITEQLTTTNN